MTTLSDQELLQKYIESRSEAAFTELLRRHINVVYSAALRMVYDADLAKDVTQSVFVALAQNSSQLADRPVLSGWLHRTAQNIAANTVRGEVRRRRREESAASMNEIFTSDSESPWEDLAPHLDAALGELNETDRDAVLLRFFEHKTAREIATVLRTSEDAAQKRVNRAIDRLRDVFARRGVTIGTTALIAGLTTNAVQAAPSGVFQATALSTLSITAATATKTIAMTTLQKTIVGALMVAAVGTAFYEHQNVATYDAKLRTLQGQQAALVAQVEKLRSERDAAATQLADTQDQLQQAKAQTGEVHKLRAEVAKLREAAQDQTAINPSTKAWKNRIYVLIEKLKEMPDKQIPELQFVAENDWANAGWDADIDTEDGVREALSKLRETAQNLFMDRLRIAIKRYAAANNDSLPSDIVDLQNYFEPPVKDAAAMLRRYQLLANGKLSDIGSKPLVKTLVYADADYDSEHEMSLNGAGGSRFNNTRSAVDGAMQAYANANGGKMPTSPSEISQYLFPPIEEKVVQKYITRITAERAGIRSSN